jgi:AraC-like DNA-binding protein
MADLVDQDLDQAPLDRVANGGSAVQEMPDMASVARDLGLSARSLRRRLADDGVSYKALVQSVLEIRAIQLLGDPNRTIQDTAAEMGAPIRRRSSAGRG